MILFQAPERSFQSECPQALEPADIDPALLQPLIAALQTQFGDEIAHARAADSDLLDNAIHGIIDATRNQAVKDRLSGLDQEIHRIFDAIEAASIDPQTARTFELMRGIVVLTTIMAAIAEARVDGVALSTGTAPSDGTQPDLATLRAEDSMRLDNTIHGIIDATRNEAFKERLANLDIEIHRVFTAIESASGDSGTVETLELVEGIVVLSSIVNAIAEARIGAAAGTDSTGSALDLDAARRADSDRLDNAIHGIIAATQNPAIKEHLAGLDREIHRVFDSIAASSADPEAARTMELMEGIVVLSSIMNAIAELRINQGMDQDGDGSTPSPVIIVSAASTGIDVLGAGFDPGERVIFSIAHTATIQVVVEGSLLNEQVSANDTGAFQATGTLPLGPGVYTLQAIGADSRLTAVAPVVISGGN